MPGEEAVAAVLPRFVGEIDQIPPRYSAKNVGGRRGYELARAGVEFELPPKRVTVYSFALLGRSEERPGAYRFRIRCGGGTYIRSLARDVGAALGTGCVMSALRRTQSGFFRIGDAVPFDALGEENIEDVTCPSEMVLPFRPSSWKKVRARSTALRCARRRRTGNIKPFGARSFTGLRRCGAAARKS